MPPIERWDLVQKAVLWPVTGYNRYGEFRRGDPVEIDVRWNSTNREVQDPNGGTVTIEAEVVVDQEIAVGGQLWLGTKDQLRGRGQPKQDIMQVYDSESTQDVNGKEVRYELRLMRSKDTLVSK